MRSSQQYRFLVVVHRKQYDIIIYFRLYLYCTIGDVDDVAIYIYTNRYVNSLIYINIYETKIWALQGVCDRCKWQKLCEKCPQYDLIRTLSIYMAYNIYDCVTILLFYCWTINYLNVCLFMYVNRTYVREYIDIVRTNRHNIYAKMASPQGSSQRSHPNLGVCT